MVHNRLDNLVSMRGLAAWLVVFFHSKKLLLSALPHLPAVLSDFIGQGYLAVDFFFVLSGFIIFINYHAKFFINFRHNAMIFYWNRISRIYPVHLFMLALYLLLAFAFLYLSSSKAMPPGYTAESFIQSLMLIHAWTGNATSWNVPSWSISAEWFVYLLFPFIAISFGKLVKGLTAHLLVAASALTLLYGAYFFQGYETLGTALSSMALVRALCEFLLGTVAGSLFIHHRAILANGRGFIVSIMLALCFVLFYFNPPNFSTVPLLCFLLVSFLSIDTSLVSKTLSNKFLVYLGEISYSTYMVHYFVYDVFKAYWVNETQPVSLAHLMASFFVILVLSAVMHRMLEVPAQRYLRVGLFKNFGARIEFRN
jgi:peptidoglycan/LPS O-acetylase OafA/YrhL